MRRASVLVSITILSMIILGVVAMLRGPLYPRYSATECLDAYAQARNLTDTAQVDLHPYAPAGRSTVRHRCGELRAVQADSAADIVSR